MDYPALQMNVNRERASELGLSPKEVVDNLITSLTSDAMIAPSYWVDPNSGNNYFVTVQYPENQVKSLEDLKAMPLHAPTLKMPTYFNQVADITPILTPTEVDHYQAAAHHRRLRRAFRRRSGQTAERSPQNRRRHRSCHPISASMCAAW